MYAMVNALVSPHKGYCNHIVIIGKMQFNKRDIVIAAL